MSKLYVIPTPIGNLDDITLRAIKLLNECDLILAEDTRTTAFLLKHLQIQKQLKSYHQHNEHKVLEELIEFLQSGKTIGLVSDAGTPAISDPGFLLVREALKNNIEIVCLPGPTAFVPALVNTGFPCNEFSFYGFLPQKKGRQTKLKELANDPKTFILYESPFRLVKLLEELRLQFGETRRVAVCRELTKLFEETKIGNVNTLINHYKTKTPKGEIVVVVEALKNNLKVEPIESDEL